MRALLTRTPPRCASALAPGLHAFLCHSLGLGPAWPHGLRLSLATGLVPHATEELALSQQTAAAADGRGVPFRLTRNLQVRRGEGRAARAPGARRARALPARCSPASRARLALAMRQVALGPFAVEGPLVAAITAAAEAVRHHKCAQNALRAAHPAGARPARLLTECESHCALPPFFCRCPLQPWLECLERDGPVRWARTPPPEAAEGAPYGAQPSRPHPIVERVGALAPPQPHEGGTGSAAAPLVSLNLRAAELVAAATDPASLARMPPGWQAWL